MGDHGWCHVVCAELISGSNFINNSKIVPYLFAALCSTGVQLPITAASQNQIISDSHIYQILPSPNVFLPTSNSVTSRPIVCFVCQQLIYGRYVRCCYDKCDFRAHPVCLAKNPDAKWNFIVDRRVGAPSLPHV